MASFNPILPDKPKAPLPVVAGMGQLAELMNAAKVVAEAADVPMLKAMARHALALMTAQLRAACRADDVARIVRFVMKRH